MPLPKPNRLSLRLHQDDFKSGQKFYSKHFTVIFSLVKGRSGEAERDLEPQFAILVSKKTAKHAVDRNRIRRLTSALIQKNLSQPASPKAGFPTGEYLVLPKSSLLTTPFPEIDSDLSIVISKIKNNTSS